MTVGLWLAVAGSATADVAQDDDAGTPLDQASWAAGDVHVHSVGDGSLRDNLACKDAGLIPTSESPTDEQKASCAGFLIEKVIAAAKANGLSWAVLSEHGVWLGVNSTGAGRGLADYSEAEARREWTTIRDLAASKSAESGVRLLIGEEIGSSWPVTGAGHFSTYYSPDYIADSPFLRSEGKFLSAVQDGRGWGGVNHPGTGSTWGCWTDDDKPARWTNFSPCPDGVADDHPGEVRALEVFTGDSTTPPQPVLDRWDELLVRGLKVAAVGGGDTHTVSRPGVDIGDPRSAGSQTSGNINQLGTVGRARTYVMRTALTPDANYRSDLSDDPVRDAITNGETLASNGPWVGMTIDGSGPNGQNYIQNAATHRLRLSWDPGLGTPTSIRLVLGQVPDPANGCQKDSAKKYDLADCVKVVDIPTEASYSALPDTMLQVDHSFRTEGVFRSTSADGDDTTITNEPPMFARVEMRFGDDRGVFSSPFYLQGSSLTTGRY